MTGSEIARWVKRKRAKKHQTQQQLADALGKSRTWVSSLERGTFRPKVEECIRLASWAEVGPGEVLTAAGYPLSVLSAVRASGPAVEPAMPEWARRLEEKVDALSEAVRLADEARDSSDQTLGQLLGLVKKALRPPAKTPDGRGQPPRPDAARPALQEIPEPPEEESRAM